MYRIIDEPRLARPAFLGWLSGGQQVFPNDPVLERARREQLRRAGLLKIRRIPSSTTKEVA